MATVTFSFTLDTTRDGEVVRLLETPRRGERSRIIREALAFWLENRDKVQGGERSLAQLIEELRAIATELRRAEQAGEPKPKSADSSLPADILETLLAL